MNKNIFNPRGTLNSAWFMSYYILLTVLYILVCALTIIFVYKYNLNSLLFFVPFLILKTLLVFNYKKRLMLSMRNLKLASVLAVVLTFDFESLALCQYIPNEQVGTVVFFIFAALFLIIQPFVVALLPVKR